MTIIITGGAGFIGSHVVRLFVQKYPDYKIINLDSLTYAGNLANLEDVMGHERLRFIKGDIRDLRDVTEALDRIDVIVNARVAMDPELLRADVEAALADACQARGATLDVRQVRSLRPRRPVPTHRYAAAVS